MARQHDARLHVLHLTTAREMELFTPGPVAGKRITVIRRMTGGYLDPETEARLDAALAFLALRRLSVQKMPMPKASTWAMAKKCPPTNWSTSRPWRCA